MCSIFNTMCKINYFTDSDSNIASFIPSRGNEIEELHRWANNSKVLLHRAH